MITGARVLGLVASAVAVMAATVGPTATPDPALGPRAIRELHTEVDGSRIRALCTDGSRQVLLLHGHGASADSWRPVLERLDGTLGACAYDRRGSGESGPAPTERGWFELIDELRRIHLALGFERDYVLVGHGLGGLYARVFAVDRRGDLAGMVLVDPAHEDMLDRLRTGVPETVWESWAAARGAPNDDGVTERSVADRVRGLRLPDLPVTVITASLRPDGEGWDARFINQAARDLHSTILHGITTGRHVPAQRSGHAVQRDQPGLVAEEILRVVRASRR